MLSDSVHVVTLPGDSNIPRLTAAEIEALCHFAFQVHDHNASAPAEPIFWYRTDNKAFWKFHN
jgi:hypothetical protein